MLAGSVEYTSFESVACVLVGSEVYMSTDPVVDVVYASSVDSLETLSVVEGVSKEAGEELEYVVVSSVEGVGFASEGRQL